MGIVVSLLRIGALPYQINNQTFNKMTARENSRDRYLYMRKQLSYYDGKRASSLKTFLKGRERQDLFYLGYDTEKKKFSKKSYNEIVVIGSDYGFGGNYYAWIVTKKGTSKRFEEKIFLILLVKIEKYLKKLNHERRKETTSNE